MAQVSLSGISALQNVPASTTIYIRYYASGQTTTGGWGFNSPSAGSYGLDFGGNLSLACAPPSATVSGNATICAGGSTTIEAALSGTGPWDVTWSDSVTQTGVTTSPASRSVSPGTTTTYTVIAVSDATGCTPGTFSGSATVTVNSPVTPSVSVSANPGTTTCAGNQVIFTATPVNAGGSPTYIWKTNGVPDASVPADSATYTNSSLANGDTIDCQLTSSLTCVTASTADALQLTMTITSTVTPSLSVAANPGTTICAGRQVIFTATPVNGGSSPGYVWKTNGVQDTSVPASSATYTNSSLANGDTIDCQLISNDPCASPVTADAVQIAMTVNATATPSVSIVADSGSTICANSSVTFTATPVNGGGAPAYQWKTNDVAVTGAIGSTYATSSLKDGDVVTVVMTPSEDICVSPANATSSSIVMTVNGLPTIALGANPIVCVGVTSADLPYGATTDSPDQYSIVFDAAAHTAGFADVAITSLPVSPIVISVPGAAAPATYHGTLVVNNSSTGCGGSGYAFAVTVSGPPSSTITAPGGVCADSTGNIASVPNVGDIASGASYAWTISGGTITSAEPQTNRVTFTAGSSGTVSLGCSVVSSNGCASVAAGSATVVINSSTLTPWVMAGGNYAENFADVVNWKDGFTCGQGANRWSVVAVNATGTIPDGKRTTVSTATFQTASASAGVQRDNLGSNPSGKIVLLTTGTTDHSTALAIDLMLDFTARNAGTLSFDWAQVNNGGASDNRTASVRVYTSVDGTIFTELTGAAVLNVVNNSGASGSISLVSLPSAFDDSSNARIRFYYYNGDGGNSGSRPKIALDNIAVTSTCNAPIVTAPTTPSPTVCAGTSVILTEIASGGLPPFAYQWKKGGSPISGATSSTYSIPSTAVGDSGTYACEVTSSCGTAATSPELTLTVNPVPSAPSTTGDGRCGGGIVNLSASGSGGTLNWYSDAGLTALVNSGASYSPSVGGTTTYYVTETSAEGCVSSATPVTGTINPLPVVSVNSATICAGGSTTLTATTDANSPGYLWSPGGATTASITVSPTTTTIYSVTVTDGTTTCMNTGSGTVTVNPLPTVAIEPAATNAECGGTVVLTASPGGDGPLTYQWFDTQTNAIAGETNLTVTLTNLHGAGAGNYTIIVTGPFCSASAVASVTVADTAAPVITLLGANPATNECHAAYSDAGATASDACAGDVNVSTNSTVEVNVPGVYVVTYTTDDGNGHTNTITRTVYVVDTVAPALTLLGANPATNECHVSYVDAGVTASDACAGDVSVSTNGTVDANVPGVYSVSYTADDGNGHTNTATRTVYVEDTTAPQITYYFTNLTLNANSSCQALMPDVTGTNYILAEDGCSGVVTITQSPTNDAVLALGTNEVVLAVADSAGNTSYSTNTIVVVDATGPVVTIIGDNPLTLECHAAFMDPGASANDNCGSVVELMTNGLVAPNVPGSYTIEYRATDGAGNSTTNTRIVNVADTVAPALTVLGANPATNECHVVYTDAGATASDVCAGSVSVSTNELVAANVPGIYTVTYTSDDGNGHTNTATRTVYVVDTVAPEIALLGSNPVTNECHVPYADAGATASDACAGDVSVSTNGTVDANVPGVYSVTYTADDGNGHSNTVTRTVYVTDTLAPTLAVLGANPATNECHVAYVDAGVTASDACAGSVSASTNSNVDANAPGVYTVTYTSDDGNGHTNSATRTVYVIDTLPPVLVQCPTNRTLVVGDNCSIVLPDFTGELMASDSCGAVTVSQNPLPGTEVGVGALLITFTATDEVSNSSLCSLVLNVTTPASANTNISISEFMAKNTAGITDDFGAYSDWIEIHNAGDCPVNLDGWSLSDDLTSLTKWRFPATNIGPGQFLVVWASDQDRRTPGAPLHSNFKLSDAGEYLALIQPDGVTIATQFSPTFPPQWPDVSYGLPADGLTNSFLATPTPGLPNSVGTNFTVNVVISEFVAKNTIGPVDDFGAHSDWIEIYNGGCCPVNLNGWSLTDDAAALTKWRFPATNIGPGQFMVVWASDRNRRTPGAPLHTNFKMADEGEYLALVLPDGVTIATQFAPTFPPQLPDVSYGLASDGTTNNYLALPTPGLSNSVGTNFLIADLNFTPGRGWFTNSVSVSLGTTTPGVTLYFTTDGTVPGPTNGFVYSSPLVLSNTTVLRAAAYRPAFVPNVATHTYVFPTEVAYQTGAGFPTNWGFADLTAYGFPDPVVVPTYYECNSNLMNNPRWGGQMPAALLSVPTLSVVMNPADMFGTNGIYSNPFGDGAEWERPCSVEYFRPDLKPGFQINCGIRMHGQISRNPAYTPKHSLRLLFKQMYGSGKLLFDLYPGSPVQDFDVLVLHASLSDHWYVAGAAAQMLRDQWCDDTQQEAGGYGTHGAYVNLYINGLYWGLYNLGERPDASYAAHYLGGKPSDYDALHGEELQGGTTNAWNELITLANAGITNDVAWSNVCYYLNVPHFVDYLLMNFYAVNIEWLDHNWWINGSVAHGVPFHFFSWDAEDGIGGNGLVVPIDYDLIGLADVAPTWPGLLFASLHQYPEFRRVFADHAQQQLFNHGVLTPERSAARWMKRAQEIDTAIIAESVRWGITNWWATSVWGSDWKLYTRDDWLAEQTYLLTNWFPVRTDMLIGQLREAGLYPALDAPVFTPHGGIIVESLSVTVTRPAETTLYYTTNGIDPRMPDGSVSPEAQVYDESPALVLALTNNTRLLARVFATNTWSALVEADYALRSEVQLQVGDITRQSNGAIKLGFQAWPGIGYTLRASTNFTDWEAIATLVPFPDGTFTYIDNAATNHPVRFYRLTWP